MNLGVIAANQLRMGSSGKILLSGDAQSGTDALKLSGDQQSGTDAELYKRG